MGFIFLYWRVDKKAGLWLMGSMLLVDLARAVIKLGLAVPRPFLLDNRLLPAKKPESFAFPSGHAAWAMLEYGGWALWLKRRWLFMVAGLLILLTGLSRNLLGVHTPQDVMAGFVVSALLMWLVYKLVNWLETHKNKDEMLLLLGLLLCLLAAYYITHKSYPSELLLKPKNLHSLEKNIAESFATIGMVTGLVISWYVDRKWLQYTCPAHCGLKESFWGIVGLLLCIVYGFYAVALLPFIFTACTGYFLVGFTIALMVMLFWPWILQKFKI